MCFDRDSKEIGNSVKRTTVSELLGKEEEREREREREGERQDVLVHAV